MVSRRTSLARGFTALILSILVSLISACGGEPPIGQTDQALGTPLGGGWYGVDLGGCKNIGGSSSLNNGVFLISGGGGDFWGYQDDGHFVYQPITGDFDIVARVTGYSGDTSGGWAKAVLAFKEDTGAGGPTAASAGVYQSLNYATDDYWYVRDSGHYISSFSSYSINSNTGDGALIRMTRVGDTFRSYHWSDANSDWIQQGGDRVLGLNASGYVGMASASSSGGLMNVTFEDVSVTVPSADTVAPVISNLSVVPNGTSATITWTTDEAGSSSVDFGLNPFYGNSASTPGSVKHHQVVITGLTESTQYHFRVNSADASDNMGSSADAAFNSGTVATTSLPSPWAGINLGGSATAGGSSSYVNGIWTVSGGGGNLWDAQDDGHFVYQPVTGDFELIAQIDSFGGDTSFTYAKAALLFKEDTGAGEPTAAAKGIYQGLSCNSDDYWYVRSDGYISQYSTATLNTVGGSARLKITRIGDVFRSYHWDSASGSWLQHGADRTVVLNSSGYVGIASTSGNANIMDVQFTGVMVSDPATPPDTTPPSISDLTVTVTDTTAHITWTTDEPATAVVDHGLDDSYGSHHTDDALLTSHNVMITGLEPTTTYHFQVASADAGGNTSTSIDATFTTTAVPVMPDPVISDIAVTNIDEHSATISWVTNIPTTTQVDYDLNSWTKEKGDPTLKLNHSVVADRMMSGEPHDFTITANNGLGGTITSPVATFNTLGYAGGDLPVGWGSLDIGAVNQELPGSTVFDPNANGGSFITRGTGVDVFGTEDNFHFVFQPVDGDFVLTLRVDGYYGHLHKWTKALAMFRVDLEPDAQMFTQSINNTGYDWLYYRDAAGSTHTEISNAQINPGEGAPVWARLTRVGNTFTQEYSPDGSNWQFHGPATGTVVNLPTSGYVGFGVASKDNAYLSEIVYSNVSLTTSSPPDVTAPAVSGVQISTNGDSAVISWVTDELSVGHVDFGSSSSYGTTLTSSVPGTRHEVHLAGLTPETVYHFSVAASDLFGNQVSTADDTFNSGQIPTFELPPEWSSIHLGGSSALGGDALHHDGVFTVTGGGGDLWGSQDDAHFVYQPIDGDFELIVQVDDYQGDVSDTYVKAALMFKEDTGAGVPTAGAAGVYQSLNRNTEDYWYERAGGYIPSYSYTSLESASGGTRLRLTRSGNTFRSYHWEDSSQSWVQHGADRTLALNSTGYAGFSAASAGQITITFSNVSLGANTAAPDTTAPVISDVVVTPAGNSTTITWTTDEPATSVVNYGLATDYGQQASTAGMNTSHQVTLTGLTENTVYHFSIESEDSAANTSARADDTFDAGLTPNTSLPTGWLSTDLGTSYPGSALFINNQFVINGAGGDFWNNSDGGHVAYHYVDGDFELQATVVSYSGDTAQVYAKAVLLFKEEVAGVPQPTADGAGVFQSLNYGAEDYWYQRNSVGGGISSYSSSSLNSGSGPLRISLTRVGNTFRSWQFDDSSQSWIQIGSDRVMALNAAGYVGLGVTSTTSNLMEVVFGDVTLTTQ